MRCFVVKYYVDSIKSFYSNSTPLLTFVLQDKRNRCWAVIYCSWLLLLDRYSNDENRSKKMLVSFFPRHTCRHGPPIECKTARAKSYFRGSWFLLLQYCTVLVRSGSVDLGYFCWSLFFTPNLQYTPDHIHLPLCECWNWWSYCTGTLPWALDNFASVRSLRTRWKCEETRKP